MIAVLILVVISTVNAKYPCEINRTIKISSGDRLDDSTIQYNGITYDPSNYFENEGEIYGCPCNLKQCIRKCCDDNQYIDTNKTCSPINGINIEKHLQEVTESDITTYAILTGKCNGPSFLVDPGNSSEDSFAISATGELIWAEQLIDVDHYCIDYIRSTDVLKALVCEEGDASTQHFSIGI